MDDDHDPLKPALAVNDEMLADVARRLNEASKNGHPSLRKEALEIKGLLNQTRFLYEDAKLLREKMKMATDKHKGVAPVKDEIRQMADKQGQASPSGGTQSGGNLEESPAVHKEKFPKGPETGLERPRLNDDEEDGLAHFTSITSTIVTILGRLAPTSTEYHSTFSIVRALERFWAKLPGNAETMLKLMEEYWFDQWTCIAQATWALSMGEEELIGRGGPWSLCKGGCLQMKSLEIGEDGFWRYRIRLVYPESPNRCSARIDHWRLHASSPDQVSQTLAEDGEIMDHVL